MTPFKIRIRNQEESKLIQQLLFKMDYEWNCGETTVQLIDYPFMYLYDTITCGKCENVFSQIDVREITLDQLLDEIENEINK